MSAITFPRAIPDALIIAGLEFQFEEMVEITPLRGGNSVSADLGPALWRAHYESGLLEREAFGEVRAWCASLMSSQKFYGYDVACDFPLAYPDGWGDLAVGSPALPFDGTCKIKTVDSSVLATLKELPDEFELSKGDLFAFNYGANGARALHLVVNGGVASLGGELQVEVRPYIRTGAAADDVVVLDRASALMNIVPGSYRERRVSPRRGYISFDAIQVKP